MPKLRALLNLLLAIALATGGLLPAAAAAPQAHDAAGMTAMAADASPPCHEQAPAPAPADTGLAIDCCDGGDCSCDCLHHAPVVINVELRLPGLRHRWVAAIGRASPLHSLAVAPAIRPPIA